MSGPADKSYGVHVAKLAKLPDELIKRAEEILSKYEKNGNNIKNTETSTQISFDLEEPKEENKVVEELEKINPLEMTPIEAINKLFELKSMLKK